MKDNNVIRGRHRGQRAGPSMRLFLVFFTALATAAILSVTSADTSLAQAVCGNGTLDLGEDCDLSSPSGAFCPVGQACTASCDCAFVATTTLPTTTVPPTTSLPPTTTTVAAPTTTTTSTLPPGGLNHFQCYESKRVAITAGPVSVQDQFGTTPAVPLSKPNRLCAPTNKQGEDPTAPGDPDHLKSWQNKHSAPKVLNQTVVNQFGTLVLDVSRPSFLLVPASKSLVGNPPPLAGPTVDHFQCYRVKRSRGTTKFTKISGVTGVDQFGSYALDLLKPRYLCAPANKNGEDPSAPSHPEHLLCYKTRNAGVKFAPRNAFTNDQFGNQQLQLLRRIELCVPSLKNPGATTTSTTAAPATTTTSSTAAPATTTTSSTGPITTTTQAATTSTVATTSTTSTTLYGSPSRAFMDPIRSLLE
jgi:hypothetical protein